MHLQLNVSAVKCVALIDVLMSIRQQAITNSQVKEQSLANVSILKGLLFSFTYRLYVTHYPLYILYSASEFEKMIDT